MTADAKRFNGFDNKWCFNNKKRGGEVFAVL
jgi:hypothetical protein